MVANLYPFAKQPGIDMIDIGGPAMVRAAAKNHAHVGVVVDPADYELVLDELRSAGVLGAATRRRLARKAFAHTAAYDAAIVTWLDDTDPAGRPVLPPTLHQALERAQPLRYGENPHQQGARYRRIGARSWWDDAVQHGGKELSYLNLYDAEAAWRLVHRLGEQPAAVVIKHANPCGAAGGRRHHHGLPAGPRRRPGVGLRRDRGRQPPGATGPGRGAGAGVHRGGGGAGLRRRRPRAPHRQEEPPRAHGAVARGRDARLRSIDGGAAGPGGRPGGRRSRRLARRHQGRPDRGAVGRPRAGLAGVRRGQLERHRAGRRAARPSGSAPGSRTGSTRRASRRRRPPGAPRAERAPATPSSRSATASTPSPPRGWPR